MQELAQLYADLENFEKDIENDEYTDVTLAKLAFMEYIDNCFDQMSQSLDEKTTVKN